VAGPIAAPTHMIKLQRFTPCKTQAKTPFQPDMGRQIGVARVSGGFLW